MLMRQFPGIYQEVRQLCDATKDFIKEEIKEHKQNWDPSDQRDYIDCYLTELQMVIDIDIYACLHLHQNYQLLLCCTEMAFHCGTTFGWYVLKRAKTRGLIYKTLRRIHTKSVRAPKSWKWCAPKKIWFIKPYLHTPASTYPFINHSPPGRLRRWIHLTSRQCKVPHECFCI